MIKTVIEPKQGVVASKERVSVGRGTCIRVPASYEASVYRYSNKYMRVSKASELCLYDHKKLRKDGCDVVFKAIRTISIRWGHGFEACGNLCVKANGIYELQVENSQRLFLLGSTVTEEDIRTNTLCVIQNEVKEKILESLHDGVDDVSVISNSLKSNLMNAEDEFHRLGLKLIAIKANDISIIKKESIANEKKV